MDMKSIVSFEIEMENRIYRFEIPAGAPLGEAYQCAGKFMDKMIELINEHQEKRKADEEKDKGTEEDSEGDA